MASAREVQMVSPDLNGRVEEIEDIDLMSNDESSGSKRMPFTGSKGALKSGRSVAISPRRWACITCFQLVYSSVNTGMGLLVLPAEAERLNSGSGSIWVGVYLAVCGLTQLACPLAGKLSDRHASKWGRRRPFIVAGTALASAGFVAMWTASQQHWPITYLVSLFMTQIAINVAFSAQCGLPADIQGSEDDSTSENTKGVVSGIVSLHSFLGSLVAMAVMMGTRDMAVRIEYIIYVGSLVLACAAVCWAAQESSTAHVVHSNSLTLKEIAQSFWIDLQEDLNFFWVCVGRMLYYISTSVVVFMYYYIRDMLGVEDESDRRTHLGFIVVVAQLIGAIFTVPLSRLSNRIGRKPVIYGACTIMSSAFVLYAVAPKIADDARWPLVLCSTILYGLGSGAYLSVDYALALDCLPVKKTSAEAFGVWGVAGFVGSTVGPVVGGYLLAANSQAGPENLAPADNIKEYSYVGFALVMVFLGCFMNCLVVLVTWQIKNNKGKCHASAPSDGSVLREHDQVHDPVV